MVIPIRGARAVNEGNGRIRQEAIAQYNLGGWVPSFVMNRMMSMGPGEHAMKQWKIDIEAWGK